MSSTTPDERPLPHILSGAFVEDPVSPTLSAPPSPLVNAFSSRRSSLDTASLNSVAMSTALQTAEDHYLQTASYGGHPLKNSVSLPTSPIAQLDSTIAVSEMSSKIMFPPQMKMNLARALSQHQKRYSSLALDKLAQATEAEVAAAALADHARGSTPIFDDEGTGYSRSSSIASFDQAMAAQPHAKLTQSSDDSAGSTLSSNKDEASAASGLGSVVSSPDSQAQNTTTLSVDTLNLEAAQSTSIVNRLSETVAQLQKGQLSQSERFEAVKFIVDHIQHHPDQKKRTDYAKFAVKTLKSMITLNCDPEIQYYLGNLYIGGVPGDPAPHKSNFAKAYNMYSSAAKKDHLESIYHVALCHERGAGTSTNKSKAAHNYKKAAMLNHPGAMYRLGMSLLRGDLGQAKNARDGVKWLRLSAKYATPKYSHALYELAMLHDQGVHNVVWTDHEYLINLLTQAAALGHTAAQYRLGEAYEYAKFGVSVDPGRSVYYYSLAASNGHPEAMFELGGWFLTGTDDPNTGFHLDQSDSDAYYWVYKAADKHRLPRAMFAVGYFHETGVGCAVDLEKAMEWYKLASDAGDPKAIKRLTGKDPEPQPTDTNKRGKRFIRRTLSKSKSTSCTIC